MVSGVFDIKAADLTLSTHSYSEDDFDEHDINIWAWQIQYLYRRLSSAISKSLSPLID